MVSDRDTSIQDLRIQLAEFARERDWEQFHSPKNLSMALAVEVAELMELFQWKTDQEAWKSGSDPIMRKRLREEIADIAVFLLNLCNQLEIDLSSAIVEKMSENARKYPTSISKGRAVKYSELAAEGGSVAKS